MRRGQDFLNIGTQVATESPESASHCQERIAVASADVAGVPVLMDWPESGAAQVAQQLPESGESSENSLPDAVAPVAPSAESIVEQHAQEVALNEMPEMEAPAAIAEMKPELEPAADVAPESVPRDIAVPDVVVQLPAIEVPGEQLQSQMKCLAQESDAEASEVVAESEAGIDPEPEPENLLQVPKPAAPAILVSGVRLARKPIVQVGSPARQEPAARFFDGPQKGSASEPMVEVAAEQSLVAQARGTDEPEVVVPETVTERAPISEEATGQLQPESAEASAQPEMESPADVTHWQPAEPEHEPELAQADAQVVAPAQETACADEFGFEPMIASLEDALAVLAAANAVHDEASALQVEVVAVASPAQSDVAPLAADAQQADDNIPEVSTLQGIFIQKETEMTEMSDESIGVDAQAAAAPITSVELQEVAATLSVPQLEADPDDVLSDVQSTLNSLAGMAQGLTQQKQAAGRLQEELEEWNNQLQERERLAGDKEERLLQLENHLKEAKTNLDRMATENNRLLAERSEALKELAQTVDLRDKTTIKRAESIQLEQQRIDEQAGNLRSRASELDERESALKRKSEELGVRLKQLQSAKDKFSAIVKSFNETVQFNSTLSAISKTVND